MDPTIITDEFLGNAKHSQDILFLLISRARAASTAWGHCVNANGFDEELYQCWVKNVSVEVEFAIQVIHMAEHSFIPIFYPISYIQFATSFLSSESIIFMPATSTGPSRILTNYYKPWWQQLSQSTCHAYEGWSWEEAIDHYLAEMKIRPETQIEDVIAHINQTSISSLVPRSNEFEMEL